MWNRTCWLLSAKICPKRRKEIHSGERQNRGTCLSYPDQHLRPNKRIDTESVQYSVVRTRYCILPAGGFQSGTESATEGLLLIIVGWRHLCITKDICSNFIRLKTRLLARFHVGWINDKDKPYQAFTAQKGCAPIPGSGPFDEVDDMIQVSGKVADVLLLFS